MYDLYITSAIMIKPNLLLESIKIFVIKNLSIRVVKYNNHIRVLWYISHSIIVIKDIDKTLERYSFNC